ncbi:MAG: hypothetical protein V1927_03665 [Candidatus Omnitrophota bacterium]
MKNVMLIAALLLVVGLGNAYASTPVEFNTDQLYDWGRFYSFQTGGAGANQYETTNSNPAWYGSGSDTPVGTVFNANTWGIADATNQEDSWGVATVAWIKELPSLTNVVWQRSASQELTFIFYGFDDNYLGAPLVGESFIYSKGGHVSVYLDNTPDFNGGSGSGGRTGLGTYTGVTDGTLVLDLVPTILDSNGTTMSSHFNFTTYSGGGGMYLDIVDGAWKDLYDTNSIPNGTGGNSDFQMSWTVNPNSPNPTGDWNVRGAGFGTGSVVPEPMSMLMVTMGVLGFAVTHRKRKQIV